MKSKVFHTRNFYVSGQQLWRLLTIRYGLIGLHWCYLIIL